MSQIIKGYNYQFTSNDSTGTDTDFIVAGAAGSKTLTQNLVVQSHSGASNTITAKVWYAGTMVFSIDYSLGAGSSLFLTELMNLVLAGDSSTPDKITLAISDALGTADSIDCIASGVEFA